MLEKIQRIHFIGIGGAGMSGIAQVLAEKGGYQISGSDLKENRATQRLRGLGVKVFIGHDAAYIEDAEAVVISSAIPATNIELVAARERGLPILQRAEALNEIVKNGYGIAVAGAHGKTTTTSMISLILDRNKLDPTVLIGGELNDIGGNAKLGKGKYVVAEADESDGSFLKLDPVIAVVTNIENDHLDYYGTLERIIETFSAFIQKVPEYGCAVLCADDQNVCKAAINYSGKQIWYGIKGKADVQAINIQHNGMRSSYDLIYYGRNLGRIELNVPGLHNVYNSLAAIAVALQLGLEFAAVADALKAFSGAGRRFQTICEEGGIRIIDDYAHHPTEIKMTLLAARNCGYGRVRCVFQPHRYTRTLFLQKEFAAALQLADEVILAEVYSAGEKPIANVSSKLIFEVMQQQGNNRVKYLPEKDRIIDYLLETMQENEIILFMGAGNINNVGKELAERLRKQRGENYGENCCFIRG